MTPALPDTPRVVATDCVSNHFPPNIRDALVRAAALTVAMQRLVVIDRVRDQARAAHPKLFRQDSM